MSETVHYKGVLKPVEKFEGETLEDQCMRIMENKELPSYFDSYEEYLLDEYYQEFVIHNNVVYQVVKECVDPYSDIFSSTQKGDGKIEFDVRYYNGGCSFSEAIEKAIENIR